ncbi:MAG TPA: hypothetical protein VH500_05450 [Nitrososphaeraceae archaeon]|jgi:hypothetical protein
MRLLRTKEFTVSVLGDIIIDKKIDYAIKLMPFIRSQLSINWISNPSIKSEVITIRNEKKYDSRDNKY